MIMANESDRMTTNQLEEAQKKHVGEIDKYNPRTGEIVTSKTPERQQIDNELKYRVAERTKITDNLKKAEELQRQIETFENKKASDITSSETKMNFSNKQELASIQKQIKEHLPQYEKDNRDNLQDKEISKAIEVANNIVKYKPASTQKREAEEATRNKQAAEKKNEENNELKRRAELLAKAKNSDNLTNKELKLLVQQIEQLPDVKDKRISDYHKPANELIAREKEENKIAELAKLEADLRDEIKQHGNGAGRINIAATLANVSQELKERREQYNADNGITEAQVASNPPKNPSPNAGVKADVKTVEKPQNNQNKQALEDSKAPQIDSEDLIAAVAPEQSQQQPKYTGALLGVGNADEYVEKLQEKLGVKADGIYGKNTEAAVKRFQRANGLDDDGVVGEKTATALLAKEVRLNGVIGGNDVKNVTPQTLEDKVTKAKGTIIGFS